MTDPNGHSTGYSYNSLGLRPGITYPSPLGAESITYDSYNLVNQVVNGKGQTTSYSWDQDNQPTGISSSDGTSVGYSLNQCFGGQSAGSVALTASPKSRPPTSRRQWE